VTCLDTCRATAAASPSLRFIAGPDSVRTSTVQPAQPPTAQAMNSSSDTWHGTSNCRATSAAALSIGVGPHANISTSRRSRSTSARKPWAERRRRRRRAASGVGVLGQYGFNSLSLRTSLKPSWSGSRFRHTGQIVLPEAQLYHYKARVYDPALGRFLQTDPVGYEDDVNLYALRRQ